MEGLYSLIFKANWNKQYMQTFACCCHFFEEMVDFYVTEFLPQIFVDSDWLWELMFIKFRSYDTGRAPLFMLKYEVFYQSVFIHR